MVLETCFSKVCPPAASIWSKISSAMFLNLYPIVSLRFATLSVSALWERSIIFDDTKDTPVNTVPLANSSTATAPSAAPPAPLGEVATANVPDIPEFGNAITAWVADPTVAIVYADTKHASPKALALI